MLTVETVLNGFIRSQLFLLTVAYLNSEWYKICDKSSVYWSCNGRRMQGARTFRKMVPKRWFLLQDLSKLCQFELVKFFLYLERWSWKYLVLKYVYMCVNSEYYQMVDCKSRPLWFCNAFWSESYWKLFFVHKVIRGFSMIELCNSVAFWTFLICMTLL